MRSAFFVGLLVSIEIANAHPAGTYDRGWRPMSKEEAFRRFRINMQKTHGTWGLADKEVMALKETQRTWDSVDPTADKEIMALKDDAMRIVEPVQVVGGFYGRDIVNSKEEGDKKNKIGQDCEGDIDCLYDHTSEKGCQSDKNIEMFDEPDTTTIKYVRIAKKLSEHTFQNLITSPKTLNKITNKDTYEAKAATNYDVTENNDETEELQKIDKNIILSQKPGYIYNKPKVPDTDPPTKNLSQKFTEILSKYIDNNLNDRNYAISRENKKVNFFKPELIYLPVPLKALHGYNSNNHMSVNTMLAVLLSNYGYYLPGSYGLNNRYRNLYRYLASNNIHNNKPFGMYKVFSDTDSSN